MASPPEIPCDGARYCDLRVSGRVSGISGSLRRILSAVRARSASHSPLVAVGRRVGGWWPTLQVALLGEGLTAGAAPCKRRNGPAAGWSLLAGPLALPGQREGLHRATAA